MKRLTSSVSSEFRPAIGGGFDSEAALTIISLGIIHSIFGSHHLAVFAAISAFVIGVMNIRRCSGRTRNLLLCAVATIFSAALVSFLPSIAQAQFLQGAETFFSETFDDAGDAITTVFGGLRGLYLIYLFISFIGVFNAVRQDEDWQAAARTPVIVVISVTVVDVLTQLVVGSGGGSA